jgi:cation:H+ antiporter
MDFILLIAGLVGLWLGTEAALRGAILISARIGMSEFVVGVVILSIGSNLPELAIAIDGAFVNLRGGNASDLIVGSAIGSGLGQFGFVLGLTGLLGYLALPKRIVIAHGAVLLGTLVLLGFVGIDASVSRAEGAFLVTVYLVYLWLLLSDKDSLTPKEGIASSLPLGTSWLFVVVGLGVVIASAELTVSAASNVARVLEIEESFIAIIVIGLGSSLPELSICIGAVIKRQSRMSVGNIIGSNIFDTLVPVGVAATISGISFDFNMLTRDLPFLFALSVLVLIFFWRKRGIQRYEATIIVTAYCAYVLIKFSTI